MRIPKISIVIPIYGMDSAQFFLKRNLDSILSQTYKDYEIVISDDNDDDQLKIFCKQYPVVYTKNKGAKGMAQNTNNAINHATGELIKILFQDDYFFNEESLREIVNHFARSNYWLVTACTYAIGFEYGVMNEHQPFYSESENTIGSPSVLTFRSEVTTRFDPSFYWVLDLDLYKQLFREYGRPKILNKVNKLRS